MHLSSSSTAKKAGDEGGGGLAGGREILEGQAPWGSAGSRERELSLSLPAFRHETGTVGDYLGNPKSGMTQ